MTYGSPLLTDPNGSGLKNGGLTDPLSESSSIDDLFSQRLVNPAPDLLILLSHPTWTIDDERYRQAYFQFRDKLVAEFPVHSIISYFEFPALVNAYSIDRTLVRDSPLQLLS